MGVKRNSCRVLMGKTQGKQPKHRWEDIINWTLGGGLWTGCMW